jgi:leader peptidase (prepilin peptidase) / N-methyltransferase
MGGRAALIVALAAIVGGALGSYAGVVATRGWRGSLEGRSHCEACGRTLRWFDLVPLLSYPLLRGRCRTCRARVPFSVYAWELSSALAAAAAATVVLVGLGVLPK